MYLRVFVLLGLISHMKAMKTEAAITLRGLFSFFSHYEWTNKNGPKLPETFHELTFTLQKEEHS